MATVKKLKEYLNNLNEDENLYIGYSDDNELFCEILTEEDIINQANEMHREFIEDEDLEDFDINDSLIYLEDMCHDYHYMELEL